jgi:hypothetical protein
MFPNFSQGSVAALTVAVGDWAKTEPILPEPSEVARPTARSTP